MTGVMLGRPLFLIPTISKIGPYFTSTCPWNESCGFWVASTGESMKRVCDETARGGVAFLPQSGSRKQSDPIIPLRLW